MEEGRRGTHAAAGKKRRGRVVRHDGKLPAGGEVAAAPLCHRRARGGPWMAGKGVRGEASSFPSPESTSEPASTTTSCSSIDSHTSVDL
jgi:hypothetical protein